MTAAKPLDDAELNQIETRHGYMQEVLNFSGKRIGSEDAIRTHYDRAELLGLVADLKAKLAEAERERDALRDMVNAEESRAQDISTMLTAALADKAKLVDVAYKAGDWFIGYAVHHAQKGSHEKAAINRERAEYCRAALTTPAVAG